MPAGTQLVEHALVGLLQLLLHVVEEEAAALGVAHAGVADRALDVRQQRSSSPTVLE
jgi:hypothetical protein